MKLVIGIDGGGTYTRAVAADLSGQVRAQVTTGAASPNKTPHARENVQEAIQTVATRAGGSLESVVCLVAGIAGLDKPEDQLWAEQFTTLPGLTCPRLHVNDAVVAHAGALAGQPGIIAIGGTGCIVYGVTEAGRAIRNYDFHHYANASARSLSYDLVYRLLAGEGGPEDASLCQQVLDFWNVPDLATLWERGAAGWIADNFERTRLFGEMSPLVTKAAYQGAPLARMVCDQAADALSAGIALVRVGFTMEQVPVALIGGMVESAYMRVAIPRSLGTRTTRPCHVVSPALPAERGAVLMALKQCGIATDGAILARLAVPFHG